MNFRKQKPSTWYGKQNEYGEKRMRKSPCPKGLSHLVSHRGDAKYVTATMRKGNESVASI